MVNLEVVTKYKSENSILSTSTDKEEVIIRPATLEDMVWLSESSGRPLEDYQKVIDKCTEDERTIMFILESQNIPFGEVTLTRIDDAGNAEYHRMARKNEYLARGGMTVGVRRITRFAFEEIDLKKLSLDSFSDNTRANRLYKRCGFVVKCKIPLERKDDYWIENPALGNFAEKYLLYMELTKERFYKVFLQQ